MSQCHTLQDILRGPVSMSSWVRGVLWVLYNIWCNVVTDQHLFKLVWTFASTKIHIHAIVSEQDMKNIECSYATNLPLQLQIALQSESRGHRPIAADELSTANFSDHVEEKDFICSQNMSYPFESSVNTEGILGG